MRTISGKWAGSFIIGLPPIEAARAIRKLFRYGSLGVITTLEFLQHHFFEMGHRDTSL